MTEIAMKVTGHGLLLLAFMIALGAREIVRLVFRLWDLFRAWLGQHISRGYANVAEGEQFVSIIIRKPTASDCGEE